MSIRVELSDKTLVRLRAEAARRGTSIEVLIAELAAELPAEPRPKRQGQLGIVGLGASSSGRRASDSDRMLADGFGRD